MNARKHLALVMVLALTLGLFGCGRSVDNENTLTVFNYGEYLDPDMIKLFTKETGIKIRYEEAATPEEMYTKFKSGAIGYDLLCTSDYMLKRLIDENELREIDFSEFKYKDNIGEKYWEFSKAFDPENRYTVPYFWGTVGILYDTTKVEEKVDSWDVLFNGKYAGKIVMQNSVRDTFMITEKYLGYSLNTTDKDEIQKTYETLLRQKPDVQAYLVDEARDEVVAGNAVMAVVYSGEAYLGHKYNPDLEYVVPKEGSNVWLDSWCITKNCRNTAAAARFLDFLCRDDVALKNFEYIYYSTPNETVRDNLPPEDQNDKSMFPDDSSTANCEVNTLTDPETNELLNKLWKQLKAE
ncbi:MAG: ABC transporter substrate-binding protein [Lachnospiraceae bacterium]|nr:ABC transporter substrate-binding protein [Lachnospiraceae bacterium]